MPIWIISLFLFPFLLYSHNVTILFFVTCSVSSDKKIIITISKRNKMICFQNRTKRFEAIAQCFLSVKMSTYESISFPFDALIICANIWIKFDLETKPSNYRLWHAIWNLVRYTIYWWAMVHPNSSTIPSYNMYIRCYAVRHINSSCNIQNFHSVFLSSIKANLLCANWCAFVYDIAFYYCYYF